MPTYKTVEGKEIEFPILARYKRRVDRVYSVMDFSDGELLQFLKSAGVPASCAKGLAWYAPVDKSICNIRLVNIEELEPVNEVD